MISKASLITKMKTVATIGAQYVFNSAKTSNAFSFVPVGASSYLSISAAERNTKAKTIIINNTTKDKIVLACLLLLLTLKFVQNI